MFSILKSAASGLLAQKFNLEVIANNIANIDTTGFKKSRASFADTSYEAAAVALDPAGVEPPREYSAGTGVSLADAQRILSPGVLRETGNTWDLAIGGEGFFQIALPDGRKAYTRDGSFQVDAQGQLTTVEGYLLDPPVTIPPNAQNVVVDERGVVIGEVGGAQRQFGTVEIATFPNPQGLTAVGHNLFIPSEASGNAQSGQAESGGRGQLMSGVLENSNVDLAEEMTRTIEAQRAYQMSIKVLQTADEMLAMANNLRR